LKQNRIAGTLILMLAIAFAPLVTGQIAGAGATVVPDHIALSWTADPSTTMTITWRTDPSVTSAFVQYQKGAILSGSAEKQKADSRDFGTDLGAARLFTSTLVKLTPNTRYAYRVGDGEHWSDTKSFTTADPKSRSFKFLIFGDSQSAVTGDMPYGIWRETVHKAYSANPDARFMVNVGDLVDVGQSGAHWNAWFAAATGVLDSIPEMPVVGNHECFGSGGWARPEYWVAQFSLPQNGPEGLKTQAYSYDYGPAHFVVLDSQGDEQKKDGDILKLQSDWLDADLGASNAVWKIVFFHKTPYGSMAKRTNDSVKAAFCPVLDKHHVDLVFNAHDHGVARTYPMKNGARVEKTSQGTVYYVSGRSGQKSYQNLEKMDYNSFFYNPLDQPNYLIVDVTDMKITVHAKKQDGTALDSYSIEK
jgi:acid phosphatase type 7